MIRNLTYIVTFILLSTMMLCVIILDVKFITSSEELTINQRLEQEDDFSMFSELSKMAGFSNAFNALNPYGNKYTAFIPNNQAFNNFIDSSAVYDDFDDLLSDQDYIQQLVKFHVVNNQYKSFDFTLGALGDTTLNGELLLIGFNSDLSAEEVVYYVNNEARIVTQNMQCLNGYMHEIDAVMTPVISTSYEILKEMDGFSIFTSGLEKTEIYKLMTVNKTLPNGKIVRNKFTLLLEPDTVFNRRGIYTIEDLADSLGSDYNFTDSLNGVNNFLRYHMLEGAYFISDFATDLYPTFGISPVDLSAGDEIRINVGSKIYDTLYFNNKIIIKNWIDVYFDISNMTSKNGAMHVISDPMEVYYPNPKNRKINFTEEPSFALIRYIEGYHSFVEPKDVINWNWTGASALQYIYLNESPFSDNNAVQISGFFKLEYATPKILSGQYEVYTRNDGFSGANAMVQFYLDGVRLGSPLDLTVGGKSSISPMAYVYLGYVAFAEYSSHQIRVEAISEGSFTWDYIQFIPVSK
jgi:uncharacterized surface protein with fasciclin (FAS1) repeats